MLHLQSSHFQPGDLTLPQVLRGSFSCGGLTCLLPELAVLTGGLRSLRGLLEPNRGSLSVHSSSCTHRADILSQGSLRLV